MLKKAPGGSKKKLVTLALVVVLAVFIIVGAVFGIRKINYYNQAADQASIVQVRELILLSIRAIKKDAPIDHRTGDVYFPGSKLYLPNPGIPQPITYTQDKGDGVNFPSELSVSTYPVRGTEKLYSARNIDELFAAVPKLQSCARGIKLVYQKIPHDDTQNELKYTVSLTNGKDLYVYLEKECPELNETAELFKNARAY